MTLVGVRDLKNQLPKYLDEVKKGGQIIVTDRGKPIAIIHDLRDIDPHASQNEILASLAAAGKIRLPIRKGGVKELREHQLKEKVLPKPS